MNYSTACSTIFCIILVTTSSATLRSTVFTRYGEGDMSEEETTDHRPGSPSDRWQSLVAVFGALGVIAAFSASIIAIVHGGRLLFGICLIITGASIGVAFFADQIRRRYQQVPGRWLRIAAAVVSALLIGSGITRLVVAQHTSSTACHAPAEISGADTSALQFTVTADLPCAMQSGNQLILVEQLLNEGVAGTVKHSEYYLAWDVKNAAGRQTFADSPAGCVTRRYYLISVTQDQLALLQQSQRTKSGSYFGEPIDTVIGKYIVSNVQTNHTCNKQA